MDQLEERVVKLETSSEQTSERLLTLERDVSVLKKTCVTKSDLSEAKTEILVTIAATEGKLRNEINGVECGLKIEIKDVESRLRTEINGVESRLRTEINGVRQDLRTEISQAKNWILFWVVASVLLAHFLPTF
jgi:hypothetical protein